MIHSLQKQGKLAIALLGAGIGLLSSCQHESVAPSPGHSFTTPTVAHDTLRIIQEAEVKPPIKIWPGGD